MKYLFWVSGLAAAWDASVVLLLTLSVGIWVRNSLRAPGKNHRPQVNAREEQTYSLFPLHPLVGVKARRINGVEV